MWVKWSEVAQLCPTLCDPMDCSLPGSSTHGIFQARILECVVISFSRGFSQPRDWTRVSCIAGRRFTIWATREVYSIICFNVTQGKSIFLKKYCLGYHFAFTLIHDFKIFNFCEKFYWDLIFFFCIFIFFFIYLFFFNFIFKLYITVLVLGFDLKLIKLIN